MAHSTTLYKISKCEMSTPNGKPGNRLSVGSIVRTSHTSIWKTIDMLLARLKPRKMVEIMGHDYRNIPSGDSGIIMPVGGARIRNRANERLIQW